MDVCKFMKCIGSEFYTGVPDSQLKALCDYLIDTYGTDPRHHVIAANEGNCAALAAGYYLATGKVPVVYMQNSGEGNIINPVASLLNDNVYAIPCIFIIGWRGEPGIHDEPQHIYQGEITLKLLQDIGIAYDIMDKETTEAMLCDKMDEFQKLLAMGKSVALVIRKGALCYNNKVNYQNNNTMLREEIIRRIVQVSGEDPIISTTGKTSRELFEIREANGQGHQYDFLTVGSMGHTLSIALGVALQKTEMKIWCIDGDGSALMHMGAMVVAAQTAVQIAHLNLVHIVINNGAHESVGGMPTAVGKLHLSEIAEVCGYKNVYSASNFEELDRALNAAKVSSKLSFIEVKAKIGARENLGRPTKTPVENKEAFMEYLKRN